MSKINGKIKAVIKNPSKLLAKIINGRMHFLDDKTYLSIMYKATFGKKINWSSPKTYNEKLQWLKLNDRKEDYTTMVDKYAVKRYVANIIGEEYIIPTLGVWNHFDEIDFDALPNQFVLKCTHDSGGLVIVSDKKSFDKRAAQKKIERCLKRNYYWKGREWPYKNVKPRIIAERYMEDKDTPDLKDYKIFCFSGEPKFLFVASDRNVAGKEVKFDYFDIEFNKLPMKQSAHPTSSYRIERPEKYDEMISIARQLSGNIHIPQVRIDLYVINGRIYFGEYTFFHHGGLVPFVPEKYDEIWGQCIDIFSNKNKEKVD